MKDFDDAWQWARSRGEFQQEYSELKHVFGLMRKADCKSYLEIGCAEGNSLYILGQAIKPKGLIAYVDCDEEHTRGPRGQAVRKLIEQGYLVGEYLGDSHSPKLFAAVEPQYDCVLIDAAHDRFSVLADAMIYAKLAKKYVFFHDIQLNEVKEAFNWFIRKWDLGKVHFFINSLNFGYAVIEVHQ